MKVTRRIGKLVYFKVGKYSSKFYDCNGGNTYIKNAKGKWLIVKEGAHFDECEEVFNSDKEIYVDSTGKRVKPIQSKVNNGD